MSCKSKNHLSTFGHQNHSFMEVTERYHLKTAICKRLFLNLKNRDGFAMPGTVSC